MNNSPEIRIGISQCLLGDKVRHDGGHKHDKFITGTLGKYFTWVPVCPEFEVGMGVPREPVHLDGKQSAPRMIGTKTGKDWTTKMNTYSKKRVTQKDLKTIHGFIFKKDSPSCGLERVKIKNSTGMPTRNGRGIFAGIFTRNHPAIPVEEEGRLNDPGIRENYIERIYAYYRWSSFLEAKPALRDFVAFHTSYKLSLLAHSTEKYRQLGRIVANAKTHPKCSMEQYGKLFMETLAIRATRKKHVNVLQHMQGHLKKAIGSDDKTELLECINNYKEGTVPLIVPITLFKHYFRRYPVDWINTQVFLNPYPEEICLRNNI